MKLVDTSSWIEQLRRNGDALVRRRVEALLSSAEAAWCPLVRLELWNGARGESERSVLREIDAGIVSLEIDAATWDRAVELSMLARAQGITVPSTDLLVAACAQVHAMAVEHCDSHFDLIDSL